MTHTACFVFGLFVGGTLGALAMCLAAAAGDELNATDELPTLRELCRREYGDEFAKAYDTLNAGGVIGGFAETAAFLSMVEAIKDKHKREWRNE